MSVVILQGDVRVMLRQMATNSVQCVVTSPPYWGLRSYGTDPQVWGGLCDEHVWGDELPPALPGPGNTPETALRSSSLTNPSYHATKPNKPSGGRRCRDCDAWLGELGLEPTPQLYVQHLVEVFAEVRRVLRPDGTLWLNLGDTYARTGGTDRAVRPDAVVGARRWTQEARGDRRQKTPDDLKTKDLIGIPWMTAFALRDNGWYLRAENIWAKGVSGQSDLRRVVERAAKRAKLSPDAYTRLMAQIEPYVGNCMPESVQDRTTRSHEHIFQLTKSERYFYDRHAVEETSSSTHSGSYSFQRDASKRGVAQHGHSMGSHRPDRPAVEYAGRRNRRSVWLIPTRSFKGAHFATMPLDVAATCIKAGTSAHGQCRTCGAPYRPVYTKGSPNRAQQLASGGNAEGAYHGEATKSYAEGLAQNPSDVKRRILAGMVEQQLTAWVPTCEHEPGEVSPQIVLDPFGGSGTTGTAAKALGRSAVLIELKPEYARMATARAEGKLYEFSEDAQVRASAGGADEPGQPPGGVREGA